MPTIGAREANRSFSKILREAESGKTVTITRNGKPIAQLGPLAISPLRSKTQRKKSLERLMGLLEKGYDLGGGPYSRDDMHER